jgi:hypothetical protein
MQLSPVVGARLSAGAKPSSRACKAAGWARGVGGESELNGKEEGIECDEVEVKIIR